MGVTIIASLSDKGVSGELYLTRPGIQEVLSILEAGKATYVFVNKIDRSARDTAILLDIRKRIQRCGGTTVYSSGQQFDDNPSGNFLFTTMAGVATFEKELIRERTVRGSRDAVRNRGQQVSTISPYGYHIVTSADIIRGEYPLEMKGKYVVDESKRHITTWLFEEYERGSSLHQIQVALESRGVLSPGGKPEWSRGAISTVLGNPVYKGEPRYGSTRTMTDEDRQQRLRLKGATYHVDTDPDTWLTLESPALVSAELWEKIQRKKAMNLNYHAGDPGKRYLLTGFLICPECGDKMRGWSSRAHNMIQYYVCRNHKEKASSCPWKKHMPAISLDKRIQDFLLEYAEGDSGHFDKAVEAYKASLTVVRTTAGLTQTEFNSKKGKLDEKERMLVEEKMRAMLAGEDGSLMEGLVTGVRQERQRLVSLWKLQADTAPPDLVVIKDRNEQQKSIIKSNREVLLTEGASSMQKKKLFQTLLKRITPDAEGKLEVQFVSNALAYLTVDGRLVSFSLEEGRLTLPLP